MAAKKYYRSLVGGAFGDVGFEAGDHIEVSSDKVEAWLAAGLIEKIEIRSYLLSNKAAAELLEDED